MKPYFISIICYILVFVHNNQCNPLNPFPAHMIAHPSFLQPAIVPLYPMQYPFSFHQQLTGSSSSQEDYQHPTVQTTSSKETASTTSNKGTKDEAEDDDANKRDDEDTFWEAASSYGKNRWTNFKDGFTELWDVFRAAGRGVKNIFTGSD